MKLPLQVTFRDIEPSESGAIEADIHEKASKLNQYCDQIMSCRVLVERHHQHQHQGSLYHVRIDITVPGKELAVSRDPQEHQAHEDAYVAVRDAFDAAKRQLQDYNAKRQQHVKHHEVEPHGRIARLVPKEDYGFIETDNGKEVYFHRNSLLNAELEALKVGTEVRFHEEPGEQGPQASSVHIEGKHHVVG